MTSLHGSRLSILLLKVWTAANLAAFRHRPQSGLGAHGTPMKTKASQNAHRGSDFRDFLAGEGILPASTGLTVLPNETIHIPV